MKITTADEMRAIDRQASEIYGLPGVALMQAAGRAFADAFTEERLVRSGSRVAMVCGPGNNGGDGFVAARHLLNLGADVSVFGIGNTKPGTDAAVFRAVLEKMGVAIRPLPESFQSFDVIGDALLGTGVRGAVTGDAAVAIERMNAAGRPIIACDIPSGVDGDTGRVDGPAVRASRTITLALPKWGLLQYPGAEFVGDWRVAEIGIPRALLESDALRAELTTQDWMRAQLPPRTQSRDANKGTFGTLLVIAGSAGMAGAATLTALSALRAGAGLVMLAVPESVLDTAAMLAPEVVLKPLPESAERTHGGDGALDAALGLAASAQAVAIGPGMTRNDATVRFVRDLVRGLDKPIVIDADGLNAIADAPECVRERTRATVLTPHPGEMGRLLNSDAATVQDDRRAAAMACSERFRAVSLLKGARTLIAGPPTPDIYLALNRRGTPALGTAGSGDVLTGVIGALLASRSSGFEGGDGFAAARAGAFLHALAGEIAAREIGTAGVLASDVRERLPRARHALYEETLSEC